MKWPEDVLNTQKMNVKDGGKQPLNFMKDKYMGWLGAEDGKTRRNPEGNDDSAEGERVDVNGLVSEGLIPCLHWA